MTKQRRFEFVLVRVINCGKVNRGRKLMEDQSYFSKVRADPSWCYLSISSEKGHFPPPGTGDRRGEHLHEGSLCSVLDRWGMAKGLLLNCLQFKMTLMPKWCILG